MRIDVFLKDYLAVYGETDAVQAILSVNSQIFLSDDRKRNCFFPTIIVGYAAKLPGSAIRIKVQLPSHELQHRMVQSSACVQSQTDAVLLFHGMILPFVIENSVNIRLMNFSIDYPHPQYFQARITSAGEDQSGTDL